jgi:hypothetical protein
MNIKVAVNGRLVQYTGNPVEWAKKYGDAHRGDWVEVRVNGKVVYKRCDDAYYLFEER